MAAPKIKTSELPKLFQTNLHDKQIIESLKKRLNENILKDPKLAVKAARIIEQWIKQKPKP